MRTGRVAMCLALLLLCGQVTGGEPKLANEKQLMAPEDSRGVASDILPVLGGKALLYVTYERTDVPTADGLGTKPGAVDRLWVLETGTGERHKLALPAVMGSDPMELGDLLRLNLLDPAGRRALLPGGTDTNKDGILDHRREKRQWVIYDFHARKAEPVRGLSAKFTVPQFDRTGSGLVVVTYDPKTGKVASFIQDLADGKRRPLLADGGPLAWCPTADVAVMLRDVGQPPQKPYMERELSLLNLATGKWRSLPISDAYHHMPMKLPRWTADGRFLYYADVKLRKESDPPGTPQRRALTRVWDRQAGKEVGLIERAVPIGPGPGSSTMVLGKTFDRQPYLAATPILHDAATGRLSTLLEVQPPADPNAPLPVQVSTAAGGKVYYWRHHGPGRRSLNVADIVMPAKGGDSGVEGASQERDVSDAP